MQGSHGLKNKGVPFEKSAGVPFIVRVPDGLKGVVSDELVSGIDIYPTVLEAAGITARTHLDGHSLFPYLKGEISSVQDHILSEYMLGEEPWRMIRTSKYKLVCTLEGYQPVAFYDMENDPYELHDLKDLPQNAGIIGELTRKLKDETFTVRIKTVDDPTNPLRQGNS